MVSRRLGRYGNLASRKKKSPIPDIFCGHVLCLQIETPGQRPSKARFNP